LENEVLIQVEYKPKKKKWNEIDFHSLLPFISLNLKSSDHPMYVRVQKYKPRLTINSFSLITISVMDWKLYVQSVGNLALYDLNWQFFFKIAQLWNIREKLITQVSTYVVHEILEYFLTSPNIFGNK